MTTKRQKGNFSVVVTPKQISVEKRLDVVIVSVNYNDFLSITLEQNIKVFDNITVVTSESDEVCKKLCDKFGVKCLQTNVMYENGDNFNKGKAINFGIKSLQNPEFVLLLDADCIVENKILTSQLETDVIYTSGRLIIESYDRYLQWIKDKTIRTRVESNRGLGFFHLFDIKSKKIDKNCLYPENFSNADGSDLVFRNLFSRRKEMDNKIIHLGVAYKNWRGRKSPEFFPIENVYDLLGLNRRIIDGPPIKKTYTYTICSYYFNFRGDLRQKNNFIEFMKQFQGYYDKMIVGVVDYGDIDFEIPCEKIVIKGDKNKKIWSKEIIINQIIDKIDTDYLLWIDGDLIYENLDWLNNIDIWAGDSDFIQLFETINYLDENRIIEESHKSIMSSGRNDIDHLLKKGYKPGGSWMGKTSILKEKKLFEKMYVGGGDTIFVYGLFGLIKGRTLEKVKEGSIDIYNSAKEWISNFGTKNCGYLEVKVDHLYHGNLKERDYENRYKVLSDYQEKISVIIPTYKSKDFLGGCIKSILSQNKNYKIEILIGIDNCEETLDFIIKEKMIYENCKIFFFEENNGPYFIRNSLAEISLYENLIFFDSDDIMYPDLLEETIKNLRTSECVRWKFMNFYGKLEDSNFEINKWHAHGVFGIRKDVFLSMNGFQPWRIGADSEFLMRCEFFNKIVYNTTEIMFLRRQHDNNQTRNQTTGLGSPLRVEVQNKLKKMKKEQNFNNPEILFTKKYKLYESL